ncbi:tripartite tricarboxylate transporter TctB family protein [Peribacillus sp. SCS-37]|uniref:tripartite tricarboxylate transporter TctB family protein n=1 Tax=Paraperibacillus esterisolvens TaxID=3115296 RepID=UPI003905EF32
MNLKFDHIAAVLFLAAGVFFIAGSRSIGQSAYGSVVGPDIFPLFLGIILVLLSIRLFYETIGTNVEGGKKDKLEYKTFFIILAAALLYILTLETIGYVITTFVFLFISFQAMERSKWITSLIISAVFSGVVYFLFVDVLKGTLPGWPIWFS